MVVERPFEWWAKRAESDDGLDGTAGRPDALMAIELMPGFYFVSVQGMLWRDYTHGYPWTSHPWQAKRYPTHEAAQAVVDHWRRRGLAPGRRATSLPGCPSCWAVSGAMRLWSSDGSNGMSERDIILSEGEAKLRHIYAAPTPDEWVARATAANLTPYLKAIADEAAELGMGPVTCLSTYPCPIRMPMGLERGSPPWRGPLGS